MLRSKKESLREIVRKAINGLSVENESDTPDFILSEYLIDCLTSFDKAVKRREKWYGRKIGKDFDTTSLSGKK